MTTEDEELKEYEDVISSYYDDIQVKALIGLKVDTQRAEEIARTLMKTPQVLDVYLVTGETDIITKTNFKTYSDLKKFIISVVGPIEGVKETQTLMVVTTFKENGKIFDVE